MGDRQIKSTRTQGENTQIALMAQDIVYIKKSVDDLALKVDHNYITKDEFQPVKQLVYGLVGLILTAVIGAIMALVLRK